MNSGMTREKKLYAHCSTSSRNYLEHEFTVFKQKKDFFVFVRALCVTHEIDTSLSNGLSILIMLSLSNP